MDIRSHRSLLILLAIALIVKLAYLFFGFDDAGSIAHLSVDESYHYKWASLIASGEILANAPYFRAPGYPFFLAGLLKLSGGSLIFVRLIQLLLGCLTLLVTYKAAVKMSGKTAAALAVLLLIFYPLQTYFEAELLLDAIFILLALTSLYYFLDAAESHRRLILAAIFFGLAALTRPTILVFLPVIAGYFFLKIRKSESRRVGITSAAIFAGALILVIAPVTFANYVTSGQFILISYQGGINFHIGNNPDADGLSSELPTAGRDWNLRDVDYLTYKESGQELQYGEQSSFWYRQGLDYIIENPGRSADLFVRKFYFLFSGHEISNNRPLDQVVFGNPVLSILPVRFSMIIALASLPFFLIRKNRKYLYFLYGMVLLYGLTVSLFFVSSRFRLPIVPLAAILAGWGLVGAWKTLRAKDITPRLFFAGVCAVGIFIIGTTHMFPIGLNDPKQALFLKGNQALREGDYQVAIEYFDSLATQRPYLENSYLNKGIAYLKLGNGEQAAAAFRNELEMEPSSAEALNNLGVIFLLNSQTDSARIYCEQALTLRPYYTDAAINFLKAAQNITDPTIIDSIEYIRHDIRPLNDTEPAYLFEEAIYLTARRRFPEAIDNHLRIIELIGRQQPSVSFDFEYSDRTTYAASRLLTLANYQLGYLYGLTGDYAASIRFSRQAIAHDSNLKEAYINLITGYRSIGDDRLADSVAGAYLSRWPAP